MKTLGALLLTLAIAAPAAAQPDPDSPFTYRLFGLASLQQFAAQDTFNAVFGTDRGQFWGGGVEVLHASGVFVDAEISHFGKTGQRAFISNGQVFQLGVPVTVSSTPIDLLAGYRLRLGNSPVTPYAGVGATFYKYKESSDFSQAGDDTDVSKTGLILIAGIEVRVTGYVHVSADVQDTRVTGIIGSAGLSQQAGEDDLGGKAIRFRIILGR